ncbi:MAG: ribulose 1,5-bisphosphate carboxylase large subunit [Nitrospirae bacterium]|nr:MAG: ribulose 1,5-bisphosphate carboxylase large subunit [Nitrospirota bacterium]
MSPVSTASFSGDRFHVHYWIRGTEADARQQAEQLCLEQTVELPKELLVEPCLREQIIGRVESIQPDESEGYVVTISFASELLGNEFPQFLNVLFGMASLHPHLQLRGLEPSPLLLEMFDGPQFGAQAIRAQCLAPTRPLLCGVLKPLGLSIRELATLAYTYALGGLDLIKDDQGLMNQPFCRFEERVTHCTEAVARANQQTGGHTLYIPNITGPNTLLIDRATFARAAGAGGVLICAGLTGFDAIQIVASHHHVRLPIMMHPAGLGSFFVHRSSGIAPSILLGLLPRLAGADISILPYHDLDSPLLGQDDYVLAAYESGRDLPSIKPLLLAIGGQIQEDKINEIAALFHNQIIIIVGSALLREPHAIRETCQRLRTMVDRLT